MYIMLVWGSMKESEFTTVLSEMKLRYTVTFCCLTDDEAITEYLHDEPLRTKSEQVKLSFNLLQ